MAVYMVTGGTRGIGREITKKLLDRGDTVFALSRTAASLDALKQELQHSRLYGSACDVNNPEEAAAAAEACRETCGAVDGLINNAGVGTFKPVEELTLEEWDAQLNTNLRGVFILSQQVYRLMKETGGGEIVNVASNLGYVTRPGASAYCASKWGLRGLSATMNEEGREYGIRVSTVSPGLVQTDFAGVSASEKTTGLTPEAVADAVVAALTASKDVGSIEHRMEP
ncbi:SDR family oxidoreductase [Alkalicoccus chagannorensis]|uniref:SDR family oxidoreductase n=1 Tax=Alkalicoccus chagannorensis TaxID=427072 RepID=UPI00042860BD|nr:SDR family oxidoreductase [Alkalicoccus chagannorensis]